MSQVEQQIHEMVQAIFNNRQTEELKAATREIAEVQADHARRGLARSGTQVIAVTKAYEGAVIRAVEKTLEELALQFRQAGRRDATLFWNLVEPKINELALSFSRSASATAIQRVQTIGGAAAVRHGEQAFAMIGQITSARVHELRLKSQFIILKTPEDRKANGIPDVAVMMWFPDPKLEKPEVVQAAQDRYEIIKEAISDASNGLATINKFDDPGVVPQDRISASIETWLEKAALVICDLAGQRHNVYYEFGYTRAVGTDVMLTCPFSDSHSTKLHLGHWQRLEYADASELKQKVFEKAKVILSKYDLSGSL